MTTIQDRADLCSHEIPDDTFEIIAITTAFKSRVKKWAYENAFTLIFLTLMFLVTWILLIFQHTMN